MPADYTNLPADIATRVAVAADGVLKARATGDIGSEINALAALSYALRGAREAERVTVEKVGEAMWEAGYRDSKNNVARAALRAAGYTVED